MGCVYRRGGNPYKPRTLVYIYCRTLSGKTQYNRLLLVVSSEAVMGFQLLPEMQEKRG